MTKTQTNLISAVAIISTIALTFAGALTASANQGSSISPPNNEITADPGETVKKTITISNTGDIPLIYEMVSNNFTAAGENGGSTFSPSGTGGLADWITFDKKEFSLAEGQSLDVNYTINIPKNASAGGHYALLFAQGRYPNNEIDNGAQSNTGIQIGANVLLNVTGQITEAASITEFSTPRGRINAGENADFTLRIKNSGNTHIAPSGIIDLYRKNVLVDTIAINEANSKILPESTRRFDVTSNKTLLPGPYKAVVKVSYGSGLELTTPEIQFAVVGDSSPWIWITGILTSLLAVLLVLVLAGKKNKK